MFRNLGLKQDRARCPARSRTPLETVLPEVAVDGASASAPQGSSLAPVGTMEELASVSTNREVVMLPTVMTLRVRYHIAFSKGDL